MTNVYHYTSGKYLEKIIKSGVLIPSNYSNQESVVWFSKNEKPPSSVVPMRMNNIDAKKYYRYNFGKDVGGSLKISFHPNQMKGLYRFVITLDNPNIINFVGSPYMRS